MPLLAKAIALSEQPSNSDLTFILEDVEFPVNVEFRVNRDNHTYVYLYKENIKRFGGIGWLPERFIYEKIERKQQPVIKGNGFI